ncbi:hypothetical protein MRX96_023945 [Rhipicephalus microplus]
MIKILILLALLALFAVSYTVAKPQYVLTYGYPYHYGYYGAYYPPLLLRALNLHEGEGSDSSR